MRLALAAVCGLAVACLAPPARAGEAAVPAPDEAPAPALLEFLGGVAEEPGWDEFFDDWAADGTMDTEAAPATAAEDSDDSHF